MLITGATARGYTFGQPAAILDPTATVTDSDSANFNTGSLQVAFAFGGTLDDSLGILNAGTGSGQIGLNGNIVTYAGTAIGTYSGGLGGVPLAVNLNASATVSAAQALVRDITFADNNLNALTNPRKVRFTLTDDTGNVSNYGRKTVIAYPLVDRIGPTVTNVGPASPNPRNTSVSTIDVTFSEPLRADTFDLSDLALTFNGGGNLINSGVSITFVSGTTYRVSGLAVLTAAEGNYTFTALATGVMDPAGNPVQGLLPTGRWTQRRRPSPSTKGQLKRTRRIPRASSSMFNLTRRSPDLPGRILLCPELPAVLLALRLSPACRQIPLS